MTAHAAIGIHDDLAPGHAGIAHRTADHEAARSGSHKSCSLVIRQLFGNDGHDDMFRHAFRDFRVRDFRRVLGADQDGIHANGLAVIYSTVTWLFHPGEAKAGRRISAQLASWRVSLWAR